MIISDLPGRLRLKSIYLKSSKVGEKILEILRTQRGILEAKHNPRSGSLLIYYDPKELKREKLNSLIQGFVEDKFSLTKERQIKILNSLMLGSLALSLWGALASLKTIHIIFGFTFLIFLSIHIYKYRNILIWR